jgi:choline dehydrogenase
MRRHKKQVSNAERNTYDYVVVGGGSAGCVLANRLSADPSISVLLLEAGLPDRSVYIHIPAGLMLLSEKYDWRYKAEPDASRNSIDDTWAAGKVLGGGSSINAMLWVRGHPADYDGWSKAGCVGWDYESVLPYFVKAETYERPGGPLRGTSGPQHVSHIRGMHPLTYSFIQAAVQAGHPFNADYNGASQEGVAHAQLSQWNGLRYSTARAYLRPARRRSNLTVRTSALVHRVGIVGGRATGVDYTLNGKSHWARAEREVVVSAGALASPKILMLSGIGPAAELAKHDIPVVVDSRDVGQNLQEHPYVMLSWHVDTPTLNLEVTPWDFVRHGLDYVFRRQGPGASPLVHALLFGHIDADSDACDVQATFSPIAFRSRGLDPGSLHEVHDMLLHDRSAVNVLPCVLHPEGRGAVTLRSANPADPIRIDHEVIGRTRDLDLLAKTVGMMRAIMAAPAMAKHVIDERMPGPGVETIDDIRQWLHTSTIRGEHPVGTCRMGSDDDSVVDPGLRVRGVEGLRVADASVFPTLTSGNPNAPVIMVGEKVADLILCNA